MCCLITDNNNDIYLQQLTLSVPYPRQYPTSLFVKLLIQHRVMTNDPIYKLHSRLFTYCADEAI